MKRRFATLLIAPALVALGLGRPIARAHPPDAPFDDTVFAPIHAAGMRIALERVADGLVAPNRGVVAPGEPGRLYVVDQTGQVWAVDLSTGARTLFLDVGTTGLDLLVPLGVFGPNTFDERGLLGLAFHPDYARNGKLYTYTSEPVSGSPTFPTTLPAGSMPDHQNVVSEWRAVGPGNPAAGVDPASRRELMRVDWPQFNHDAGDLQFGPDAMLYISMGDGGGADDRDGQQFVVATGSFPVVTAPMVGHGDGNAQKLTIPLGKILRIDVDGRDSANGQYGIPEDNPFVGGPAGTIEEIFAFGLRNPFRFSFDTATGELRVGDVGQNDLEEVDRVIKGGNHGWNLKEGTLFFDPNGDAEGFATPVAPGPVPAGLIDPIAQYDTHHEGHAVIGGFVYRGSRIPQLFGRYVFGEFSRLFNFPGGPNNFGRLLHLAQRRAPGERLFLIKEFTGFEEEIARLGLTSGASAAFPRTLAVLGTGQDARGELYVMGNISGTPFGTEGVVLRLAPPGRR